MGVIIIVCVMCICVQYGCAHNRMYYVYMCTVWGVIIIVCIMCICVQYGCDHNRMYYVYMCTVWV